LARAGLADEAERLTLLETEVDANERGHVVTLLLEGLADIVHLEHDPVRFDALHALLLDARSEAGNLVGVVAAGPSTGLELDDRRDLLVADVGRELAAIDEHARRERGSDLRQRAGNRGQQLFVLADTVPRQRVQQPD